MRILTENKSELLLSMIEKLHKDPDKFERMFAAKFIAKYNFLEGKESLENALNDEDPDVVTLIKDLLQNMDQGK